MSATPSPSADPAARPRSRIPRRARRLLPRTFQGRLTIAFVAVIALTLVLVSALVLNRLDDYFTKQQADELELRASTINVYVQIAASASARGDLVVGIDNTVNPAVRETLLEADSRRVIADQLGRADVTLRLGRVAAAGDGFVFIPATDGSFEFRFAGTPARGQSRETTSYQPDPFGGGDSIFNGYAVQVELADPYTFRRTAIANVTGLLAAVALFALGLSMLVSAALARRFTSPLRQLTEAARALEEGDLSSRVPAAQLRAGSSELSGLAVQFNAMADRVEESVDLIRRDRDRSRDFLADVSHELRTPLAALRTFNDLLKEHAGDDPDARAEFLESSGQQIERLDWLAQNLLELSKLDSGLVLLDLRPNDLRAAVETAVDQTEAAARKRGIFTVVRLPDTPVRILHDSQRIGQVVANLVANAIKFTPRDGSVSVDLEATPEGVSIVVADTGVGIDQSELPHIFDRFYRGAQANEARGSGSGLGLAIVRSIVDMHGGTIVVESHLGQGSRFTVHLPRDPRLVAGSPAAERSDVASAADVPRRTSPLNMTETSPSDRPQVNPEPAP